MPQEPDTPAVELSAVVVTDARGRILLDYSERWQAFTLPVSKLHPLPMGKAMTESASEAAVRAAAEVLGRPIRPADLTRVGGPIFHEDYSGGDGALKRYQVHLFILAATDPPQPLPGHVAVWLTREELADREPVSPTVAVVLAALKS
jgi:hypothetical protein